MVLLLVQRLVAFELILEEVGQKLVEVAEKELLLELILGAFGVMGLELGQKLVEVGQKVEEFGEMG